MVVTAAVAAASRTVRNGACDTGHLMSVDDGAVAGRGDGARRETAVDGTVAVARDVLSVCPIRRGDKPAGRRSYSERVVPRQFTRRFVALRPGGAYRVLGRRARGAPGRPARRPNAAEPPSAALRATTRSTRIARACRACSRSAGRSPCRHVLVRRPDRRGDRTDRLVGGGDGLRRSGPTACQSAVSVSASAVLLVPDRTDQPAGVAQTRAALRPRTSASPTSCATSQRARRVATVPDHASSATRRPHAPHTYGITSPERHHSLRPTHRSPPGDIMSLLVPRHPCAATGRGSRGDLVERRPAHAVVPVDVLDQPLEHQQHLRPARDVRVDREREDGVVGLAVDPVELVAATSPRCGAG